MESAQNRIGEKIAALRRAKGLTQEQLADQLGVSAPAVSKWETGSSCPDITLLCPLARALDTNVDTLLQFERTLSEQEAQTRINDLLQAGMTQQTPAGWAQAEAQLEALVHQYPACMALLYHAAVAYDALQMFDPAAPQETQKHRRARKQVLLERVRAGDAAAYWQSATVQLATMALADGALEKGAALLRELPESSSDLTSVWAMYHLKKGEPDKARDITQRQLYKLVSQVQTCLATLMNPQLVPQPERLRRISLASGAVAQTFGLLDMSDGPLMEAYVRMGELDKAAACFVRYVDVVTGPAAWPDAALFAPGLAPKKQANLLATTRELRKMIWQSITEDEKYRPLFADPAFAAALEKLKASLKDTVLPQQPGGEVPAPAAAENAQHTAK